MFISLSNMTYFKTILLKLFRKSRFADIKYSEYTHRCTYFQWNWSTTERVDYCTKGFAFHWNICRYEWQIIGIVEIGKERRTCNFHRSSKYCRWILRKYFIINNRKGFDIVTEITFDWKLNSIRFFNETDRSMRVGLSYLIGKPWPCCCWNCIGISKV